MMVYLSIHQFDNWRQLRAIEGIKRLRMAKEGKRARRKVKP